MESQVSAVDSTRVCAGCLKRVPRFCHCTSYACPTCGPARPLSTTIINFGESLEPSILGPAERWGETADVCLALGSSLTVTPAAGIPERIADRGGALVIGEVIRERCKNSFRRTPLHDAMPVNKQETPLDSISAVKVHASVDDVMVAVMTNLGIAIPPWDEGACWAAHAGDLGALTDEARAKVAASQTAPAKTGAKSGVAGARTVGTAAAISSKGKGQDSIKPHRALVTSSETYLARASMPPRLGVAACTTAITSLVEEYASLHVSGTKGGSNA